MGLIIWESWLGEFYAFCRVECLRHYEASTKDPNYPFEKATFVEPGVRFGCYWCGGDLTEGLNIEWMA